MASQQLALLGKGWRLPTTPGLQNLRHVVTFQHLSGWPLHGPAAEQVKVQVVYGFAAMRADVGYQPIAPLSNALLPGYLGRYQSHVAQQPPVLFVSSVQIGNMLARDQQNVDRSLGIQVPKGHH